MKKYLQIALLIFCVSAVFTSCKDDDDSDDAAVQAWKLENEQAFAAKANDPDYFEIKIQGAGNYVLYAKKLKEGTGEQVYYTSHITAYYRGWLIDKTRDEYFDKCEFEDGAPVKFAVAPEYVTYDSNRNPIYAKPIGGWTIALQNMRVGDKWEVWIPQLLGYGAAGYGNIPSYSTLVFEIEVMEVAKEAA